MKKNKIISKIAIIVVLLIFIGCFGLYKYINRIENIPLKGSNEELNISESTEEKSKEQNIENILLLGLDKQENATDTIMVLSLDKDNNEAKLTSIKRDTYVNQGEGKANKINYAYHYGGVEGTVSTLNGLFDLDISKYALIEFEGLENVVDYLGGISLNITEQERSLCGASNAGNVILNGKQALGFSRIRKIDNDAQRTSRQRKVMFAILEKFRGMSLTSYTKVISDLSSNIKTNLSINEMISIAKYLVGVNINSLKEFRIPMDGTTKDNLEGVYHLKWDKDINTKALHEFIYGK